MAMRYLSILALSTAVAADWALYCGDSCSDGSLVVSGSTFQDTCASLGGSYDYCYMLADSEYYVDFWKAIFFENTECLVNYDVDGYHISSDIFNGSCTAAGPWTSYYVVENA